MSLRAAARLVASAIAGSCAVAFSGYAAPSRATATGEPCVALASCPALRSLPKARVVRAMLVTDACRAVITMQVTLLRGLRLFTSSTPASVPLDSLVCALLQHKASILGDDVRESGDSVVLQIASHPTSWSTESALRQVREFTSATTSPVDAIIVSPDDIVSSQVLERYGRALIQGMGLWQSYMLSLSSICDPPVPGESETLALADLIAMDRLMFVMARLCETAVELETSLVVSFGNDGDSSTRTASILRPAGPSCTPGFAQAIAIAHVATCLAKAFCDDYSSSKGNPLVMISAESTKDLRAIDLLSEYTHLQVQLRITPSNLSSTRDAYAESSMLHPRILAIAGLQRISATGQARPTHVEYTRGIGDLQTSRLRRFLANSSNTESSKSRLTRREIVGSAQRLGAAHARTALAREALRVESAALRCRVRALSGR